MEDGKENETSEDSLTERSLSWCGTGAPWLFLSDCYGNATFFWSVNDGRGGSEKYEDIGLEIERWNSQTKR